MADIWMDVDVALSEVPVNIMPLLDDTDFKTRETAVAYNAAGMDLTWNFVTTDGSYTQTAVTPTTSGTYDWTHQGDGMYSIEIPASGGASINNDTEGFGWFTGVATGVLPWRGPVIGFRAAALNNSLIDAGTTGLLGPTTAGRTLDVSAGGEAGVDWANVGSPTTAVDLSGTTIKTTQKVDVDTIKTNPVVNAGTITFPSNATLASTTNITAGTITTATNVTTVNGLANNTVTAAALAADAVTEIQGAILSDATPFAGANIDATVSSRAAAATALSTATWTNGRAANLDNLDAAISTRSTVTTGQVNAEVVDALATDTYAEPGQGAPAATTTLAAKINYLYKFLRNKMTSTATEISLYNDAGNTVDQKATHSDDDTTYTRGEWGSGA